MLFGTASNSCMRKHFCSAVSGVVPRVVKGPEGMTWITTKALTVTFFRTAISNFANFLLCQFALLKVTVFLHNARSHLVLTYSDFFHLVLYYGWSV